MARQLAGLEPLAERLVSIGDPGEPPPRGFERYPQRLRLQFHDVELPAQRLPAGVQPPQVAHMEALLRFAPCGDGSVLLHCQAGISRSAAAAYTLLCAWLGPDREREALRHLYAICPWACPNEPMVELADALLQRQGRMLEALVSTLPMEGRLCYSPEE